jgi:alkanesulfonate monooxygenase SsuD/methylene tetrahydromethanopterin reductase-like flavin-dependent oxidoreductase (luciferase family)
MPPHITNIVTIRPRSLANVLADLREARRDYDAATNEIAVNACRHGFLNDDADDRASEADARTNALREEFASRFLAATGLTWKQIEDAVAEAVL